MAKTALVLGCSHAAGTELYTPNAELETYPAVIAQNLRYSVVNRAVPGSSNDSMFRIAEQCFRKNETYNLVIACWTGFTRTEFWNDTESVWNSVTVENTDDYSKQWLLNHGNDVTARLNKIKNILALNLLAKSKGIPVINIDSFWPVFDFNFPETVYRPIEQNFWDWALVNNFDKTDNGHFGLDAHNEFAKIIIDSIIKDNYL